MWSVLHLRLVLQHSPEVSKTYSSAGVEDWVMGVSVSAWLGVGYRLRAHLSHTAKASAKYLISLSSYFRRHSIQRLLAIARPTYLLPRC